jgi:hypothetical protein
MELQDKPDSEHAMQRIEARLRHETLDCLPVRFGEHNAGFAGVYVSVGRVSMTFGEAYPQSRRRQQNPKAKIKRKTRDENAEQQTD